LAFGDLRPRLRGKPQGIEGIVDADPVAALVRQIMAQRSSWTGSAAELLRVGGSGGSDGAARDITGWPKNPRAPSAIRQTSSPLC
jgi:hypothetical protein